ncbi:MarR family winged helix-turn-helix transcriptional regulator [Consotaella aegiceratis]|uniref:MarR family winged helix-turn-helix transcriptional regulator n=1 Tax=Consotaella aegiceratis TaxID=3097961 RepID=UPI002F4176FF
MSVVHRPAEEVLSFRRQAEWSIGRRVGRVATVFSRLTAGIHRRNGGLTGPEFHVLMVLGAGDTGNRDLTSTVIVEKTAMDKTKVSRAVASLDERGWVKRNRATYDRRFEYLSLTEQGRRAYDDLLPKVKEAEAVILHELTEDERRCLEVGLSALDRALERRRSTTPIGNS